MKYGLLVFILILVSSCVHKLPEECTVDKNERVYDEAIRDTVVVYYKKTNGTGDVRVRNKYGQIYYLNCGEYKKID